MLLTHQHIRVTWNNNNNNQYLIFKKRHWLFLLQGTHTLYFWQREGRQNSFTSHCQYAHPPTFRWLWFQDRRSRDRFSHKANNKIGMFHKIRFDEGKNAFILQEMYRVRNLTTNCDLRRRHLLLNYRQVIWIIMSNVQQYKWWRTSTWRRLEAMKFWTLARKILFILQNPIVASKLPHNSLSRSCSSLLVRLCVLKHPDASFSNPKTLSQLQNTQGPLLRLRFRFLRLRGLCFRVSTRWSGVSMSSCVFSNATIFSESYLRICAPGWIPYTWIQYTVTAGYSNTGLCDTSSIAPDILYQLTFWRRNYFFKF